jgi:hypothetical protein
MSPPSTHSPAGVPSGGSGKYVAIAAILILGIGGLVVWRCALTKPEPIAVIPTATVPSASASQAPPDPRIEDIPPPPPVIDAGPDTGPRPQGTGGTVVVVQNGGCGGTCTGVETPELVAALRQRGAAARSCYEAALRSDPGLRGRVSVNLRVAPSGQVCSASLGANELGAGVGGCVANIFRGVTYPAPKGGCKDVNIPLSFVPQGR